MTRMRMLQEMQEQFGISRAEAVKVLRVFQQVKAVRADVHCGGYELTNGAFWDAAVIRRALEA